MNTKLPEHLDRILNDKCISHSQLIQAITTCFLKFKALYGESEEILWFAKAVPKEMMRVLRDEHVDVSSATDLDAIASRFDIKRSEGQTDAELRDVIKRVAL